MSSLALCEMGTSPLVGRPARGGVSRAALSAILRRLRGHPSRTWSIVITIYGDAIVPRGGCVWLGTLLAFFKAIDVPEGVVRTAMSRLASDGWLERIRVGRKSFYRLAARGRATFAEATRHIYTQSRPNWTNYFDLLLLSDGPERETVRTALGQAGFGSPSPGLWIAPGGRGLPTEAQGGLKLQLHGEISTVQTLAARTWRLETLADAYLNFIRTFQPMRSALEADVPMSDLDALVTRVLLIHEYRRVELRDPILPAEILPDDWPGGPARTLCADLYKKLVTPSERWLDAYAVDENGTPLPTSPQVFRRFQD
jgi:phenylacetic acid degradation operon negative regulatory protein